MDDGDILAELRELRKEHREDSNYIREKIEHLDAILSTRPCVAHDQRFVQLEGRVTTIEGEQKNLKAFLIKVAAVFSTLGFVLGILWQLLWGWLRKKLGF